MLGIVLKDVIGLLGEIRVIKFLGNVGSEIDKLLGIKRLFVLLNFLRVLSVWLLYIDGMDFRFVCFILCIFIFVVFLFMDVSVFDLMIGIMDVMFLRFLSFLIRFLVVFNFCFWVFLMCKWLEKLIVLLRSFMC